MIIFGAEIEITAAGVGAAAASAAVIGGWWAAINGVRTLRQARRDSRERSRPMVAVELRMAPYADAVLLLVIRNYGPSIAKNLRVAFDPSIQDPDSPVQSVAPMLKRRYARPIPTLTPGVELSNVWFIGEADEHGLYQNSEPMPDRCTVTVSYESADGSPFSDDFVIDVDVMKDETTVDSSKAPQARLKAMLDALKSVDNSLKVIAASLRSTHGESPTAPQGLPEHTRRQLLGHQPTPGERASD